jgi:flavonoid 3'-monooxygenase
MNGGTETSSTTIEWGMQELMLHRDILKRAQAELDLVVGANRVVQESDIPNLPYLQAIVKETFRLHTVVPLSLPRQSICASNDVLGYKLPVHTHLILNLYAIHRDPNVYENPDTFNPDRFLGNHHPDVNPTSGSDSYELIPFSAGRRMCPAVTLGNTLVSLLMAHLLHSFDWELPKGCDASRADWLEESFGLTLCSKIPLSVVARPRKPAFLY